jgi:hypothetical protein
VRSVDKSLGELERREVFEDLDETATGTILLPAAITDAWTKTDD